jgi:uncharacterized protein (DUF1330 family)
MPAYVIANMDVHDAEGYEEYRRRVPPTIAAYGGRYVARGGETRVLEGEWSPGRLVILEFPSMAAAEAWWNSPEYRPLRTVRDRTSRSSLVLIDGL